MSEKEEIAARAPRIVSLDGPLKGRTIPVSEARILIGRERGCDIQVADESVSRKHALIGVADDGSVWIGDTGSRNGTFVNGVPVSRRQLAAGDQLRLGRCHFLFVVHQESDSPPSVTLSAGSSSETRTELSLRREDAVYLRPVEALDAVKEPHRVAHNLKALFKITGAMCENQDLYQLARNLIELVTETIPASEAAIVLFGRDALEPHWSFGWQRGAGPVPELEAPEELIRRCFTEDVAVLSNEPVEASAVRAHSMLVAPLRAAEGAGGAVYLAARDELVAFDAEQLQLLTAIGTIAGFALESAWRFKRLRGQNRQLREEIALEHSMVGESPAMQMVFRFVAKVASAEASVLLTGESGTGKELVARAIHRNGPRAEQPFVAVNCAALTDTLIESELFGHEKGAFTGAVAQRKGKFEEADGGTIFLDEIGEIPLPLQAKLLRVLQEREFDRVGGAQPVKVNVRVIAATNRDLRAEAGGARFREDLYYRLNVVSLRMPALRERKEDIPLLASYFAARISERAGRKVNGVGPAARRRLLAYAWPGNVRELENAIERAVVLGSGEYIEPEDLPEELLEAAGAPSSGYHEAVREAKRSIIRDAIDHAGGSQAEAAKLLGINPTYLSRLIRNLDMKTRPQPAE